MRAYLSTGRIRPDAFRSSDPAELQHRAAYQARVEARALLLETEPKKVPQTRCTYGPFIVGHLELAESLTAWLATGPGA